MHIRLPDRTLGLLKAPAEAAVHVAMIDRGRF